MKNKKQNTNQGITLIALIITVIVLLILAGTAISIAINGGDIFSKATTAKEEWNTKTAEEEQTIKDMMYYLKDMKSTTIYGRVYDAFLEYENGMTWREFAESENGTNFNIEQLGTLGEYIITEVVSGRIYYINIYDGTSGTNTNVSPDSTIKENGGYSLENNIAFLEEVENIYPSQSKTYRELWDATGFQEIKNLYNLSVNDAGIIVGHLGNYELLLCRGNRTVSIDDTCSNSDWLSL